MGVALGEEKAADLKTEIRATGVDSVVCRLMVLARWGLSPTGHCRSRLGCCVVGVIVEEKN